ncbi:MAG: aminotransferase class I/II-fold pyridoxal phosphate-dependent enzyme [Bacteroidota bacterium]
MAHNPANKVQDHLVFGEFGGVNPSITDSSTFTFLTIAKMKEMFDEGIEGCFLYSRHMNPSNDNLGRALAQMEGAEAGKVTASGMSAIACAILQICNAGDEIVSSRTVYGGTYAILKNFFPKFNINTKFVDITDLEKVEAAITPNTKVIYTETISNPLLEVADLEKLRALADKHGIKLIVDNTFSPMIVLPMNFGAHIVVYSLTKYINGASDTVGGAILGKKDYVHSLLDLHEGAVMLLGPTMDSLRSSSIYKNLRTLHIRMHQHSRNGMFIAEELEKSGIKVFYPGLKSHPQHELMKKMLTPGYGFGGMITVDAKDEETANQLMMRMQQEMIGYVAVSLGFYKTLFSSPGSSTSSEIPKEEQAAMGMTPGLVRFSIGLDDDIQRTLDGIKKCMKDVGLL